LTLVQVFQNSLPLGIAQTSDWFLATGLITQSADDLVQAVPDGRIRKVKLNFHAGDLALATDEHLDESELLLGKL
jgi:hypothetical protein